MKLSLRSSIGAFGLLVGVLIFYTNASLLSAREFKAYNSETLTITNGVIGFTSSKITDVNPVTGNNAQLAVFTVNCASGTSCILRFKVDGNNPSTSVGLRALYGDTVTIEGNQQIVNFKAIREIATDVIIDATYFK